MNTSPSTKSPSVSRDRVFSAIPPRNGIECMTQSVDGAFSKFPKSVDFLFRGCFCHTVPDEHWPIERLDLLPPDATLGGSLLSTQFNQLRDCISCRLPRAGLFRMEDGLTSRLLRVFVNIHLGFLEAQFHTTDGGLIVLPHSCHHHLTALCSFNG